MSCPKKSKPCSSRLMVNVGEAEANPRTAKNKPNKSKELKDCNFYLTIGHSHDLLYPHMNFVLPPLSSMDSEFARSPPKKAWHVYNIRSDLDLYTNIIK